MPAPPIPPPFDQVGSRPFSFFPAILGIEHNQWAFRKATWSEALVFNPQANLELWIPRRFLGEASRIDEPVVILGLTKELEYRSGIVVPHERRVIQMPMAVNESPRVGAVVAESPRPAPVVGIKLESGPERRIGRLLISAIAVGILACIGVVLLLRDGRRISYQTVVQSDLSFTSADGYSAVVSRMGAPEENRWRSDLGEMQYQMLGYPRQNLWIVLMGPDRRDMHYAGAFNRDWRVVHSANPDVGRMLHNLKRF